MPQKIIGKRKQNPLTGLLRSVVDHPCLKRARLLYILLTPFGREKLRINIAMRCRDDASRDWGHAWLTRSDRPVLPGKRSLIRRPMTLISDDGHTRYYLYD